MVWCENVSFIVLDLEVLFNKHSSIWNLLTHRFPFNNQYISINVFYSFAFHLFLWLSLYYISTDIISHASKLWNHFHLSFHSLCRYNPVLPCISKISRQSLQFSQMLQPMIWIILVQINKRNLHAITIWFSHNPTQLIKNWERPTHSF